MNAPKAFFMLLASLLAGLLQTGRIDAPAEPLLHHGPGMAPGAESSWMIGRAALPVVSPAHASDAATAHPPAQSSPAEARPAESHPTEIHPTEIHPTEIHATAPRPTELHPSGRHAATLQPVATSLAVMSNGAATATPTPSGQGADR